ncbi:phenol 2-monooxygenase like protein [Zymoseptoria brevis]|uniref:Phenol 2-monooxygenase like protein n=1 Tax=Zymoseptoria brevis TaxID=1047168 RepID=A0A0F4G9S9_9PEZI|nr:phenol 2-monooxygenase like protein [Zymoseptoria brevis]
MGEVLPTADEHTDVIIVGAGPAGLMASLSLSASGIPHQIIDKLGTRALNGRADGFHPRTLEIWNSFDIADKVESVGYRMSEIGFWGPHPDAPDEIVRQRRDVVNGGDIRQQRGITIHQGYIEAALMEGIRAQNGPFVQRGVKPSALSLDNLSCNDHSSYPITLEVDHLKEENLELWGGFPHSITPAGQIKEEYGWTGAFGRDSEDIVPHVSGVEGRRRTIRAKYLIGADGGHSWVRRQFPDHFLMEGVTSNSVFGVIDIIPVTDFPDIRKICTIMSAHGSVLLIPRENNLVRLYIRLADGQDNAKQVASLETAGKAFKIAQKIFQPYEIGYNYCDWSTVYTVGQRIANHYSYADRVFLAGDAVHTHTPSGGHGCNVSQQDTYNLGFKLAGVLQGQLAPSVLSTYESERRPIAQELIDLDTTLAKIYTSDSPASFEEVKRIYARVSDHGSGNHICYGSSLLVAAPEACEVSRASALRLGQRMPDAEIINHASGGLSSIHAQLKTNGRWRMLVFAGSLSDEESIKQVNPTGGKIAELLESVSPKSDSASTSKGIQVVLIHAGNPADLEVGALHSVYYPFNKTTGYDYNTVFAATSVAGVNEKNVYDILGIGKDAGAIVIIRPDQVVGWIGGVSHLDRLRTWLHTFMVLRE